MKGILTDNYIFKNVEVKKGIEVEIIDGFCTNDGFSYKIELQGGRQIPIESKYIDITDYRPYVDVRTKKFEAALAVLQGIYANGKNDYTMVEIAAMAEEQAEIFIKRVEKKL